MNIYLVRHGQAESVSSTGRDEDRQLTDQGKMEIAALGKTLGRLNVSLDAIFSSPFKRAQMTGNLIADNLLDSPIPQVVAEMACGANFDTLRTKLAKDYKKLRNLLLVGHMPDLGEIVSEWTHRAAPQNFRPGTLCRLHLPSSVLSDDPAQITLYLDPSDYSLLSTSYA